MRASAARHQGAKLTARAGAIPVTGRHALLVSNNAYDTGDIAGLGHRARLDTGALGVVAVTVNSAVGAVELLGGGGVTILAADEVVVDADVPEIAVGIDGEAIMMCTPVRCTIQPRALRSGFPKTARGQPAQACPRLAGSAAADLIPLRTGVHLTSGTAGAACRGRASRRLSLPANSGAHRHCRCAGAAPLAV